MMWKTGKPKGIARLWALLLCLLLLPLPAAAGESAERTITVAYYESSLFQEGASDGAVKSGYSYEYLQKLSYYTGWRYEYVYGGFSDLYDRFVNGEIDLMAGISRTEEREGQMLFPDEAMGSETYSIFKRSDDTSIRFGDPASLSGKAIGTLRNTVMTDDLIAYLSENGVDAEIKLYDSFETRDSDLASGLLDAVVGAGNNISPEDGMFPVADVGSSDFYLCTPVGRDDLLNELNAASAEISKQNLYFLQDLYRKYYMHNAMDLTLPENEAAWLTEHDTLRVGYLKGFLPYCDSAQDGSATGLVVDLVPEILKSVDPNGRLDVIYQGYDSYEVMLNSLSSDAIDVVFPVFSDIWYSEQKGIFQTTPVISSSIDLICRGEVTDDTTKVIAVNLNNLMQYRNTLQFYPDAEIYYCDSIEGCLDAVRMGLAGCTLTNGLRSGGLVNTTENDTLRAVQLPTPCSYCFGIKSGDTALVSLMDRGISALSNNYAFRASYAYLGTFAEYTVVDFARDHAVPLLIALLAVIALIVTLFVMNLVRSRRAKKKDAAAAEALQFALQDARSANMAKTTFLNNMSHDIRTPMNAIIGYTALAGAHLDRPVQVQSCLEKISTSSTHLLSLINDVLDMNRIEGGKVRLDEKPVRLPDLLRELRTITQSSVAAGRLELTIAAKDVRNEVVVTDKQRLNQILVHLVGNAVKFTPPGGSIHVLLTQKVNANGLSEYEFRVRDTGIGMTKEFQKHLFESFAREEDSAVSGIQGTGLGLAITKNLVEMMGGLIDVVSEKGKGTEFILTLPFQIAEGEIRLDGLSHLRGRAALVVSGDPDSREATEGLLKRMGMIPHTASTAGEALVRTREASESGNPFAATVLDWALPDLHGVEATRKLRALVGEDPAILMLTDYDEDDIDADARAAGIDAFCRNPLFLSELAGALAKILPPD